MPRPLLMLFALILALPVRAEGFVSRLLNKLFGHDGLPKPAEATA